jgi:hypothetical protein
MPRTVLVQTLVLNSWGKNSAYILLWIPEEHRLTTRSRKVVRRWGFTALPLLGNGDFLLRQKDTGLESIN